MQDWSTFAWSQLLWHILCNLMRECLHLYHQTNGAENFEARVSFRSWIEVDTFQFGASEASLPKHQATLTCTNRTYSRTHFMLHTRKTTQSTGRKTLDMPWQHDSENDKDKNTNSAVAVRRFPGCPNMKIVFCILLTEKFKILLNYSKTKGAIFCQVIYLNDSPELGAWVASVLIRAEWRQKTRLPKPCPSDWWRPWRY